MILRSPKGRQRERWGIEYNHIASVKEAEVIIIFQQGGRDAYTQRPFATLSPTCALIAGNIAARHSAMAMQYFVFMILFFLVIMMLIKRINTRATTCSTYLFQVQIYIIFII